MHNNILHAPYFNYNLIAIIIKIDLKEINITKYNVII